MRLSTARCWVKLEAAGKKRGSFSLCLHKVFSNATIYTRLALLLLSLYPSQLFPHKMFQVPRQTSVGIKTSAAQHYLHTSSAECRIQTISPTFTKPSATRKKNKYINQSLRSPWSLGDGGIKEMQKLQLSREPRMWDTAVPKLLKV